MRGWRVGVQPFLPKPVFCHGLIHVHQEAVNVDSPLADQYGAYREPLRSDHPESLVNEVVPSEPPPRPLAASVMQTRFKDEPLAAGLRNAEGVAEGVGHEVTVTADKTLLITNAPSMSFGIRPY